MKRSLAKIVVVAILAAVVIIGIASIASKEFFGVTNPFSSIYGLSQVVFTDSECVEIQQYPRVVITKVHVSLDEYMESRGYVRDWEQQMDDLFVFTTGDFEELIECAENKNFNVWRWHE